MTIEKLQELNSWIDVNLFDGGKFVGIMKHGLWYRPNAQGYTDDFMEAGRFTREEAKKHEQLNCEDKVTIHDFPVRDYSQPSANMEVLKKCFHKTNWSGVRFWLAKDYNIELSKPEISVKSETLETSILLFAQKLFSK